MELDKGSYTIEVSQQGYGTDTRTVSLAAGEALRLDIALQQVQTATKRSFTESTTGMEFVRIPGGCFQMGQSSTEKKQLIADRGKEKYEKYYNDERPRHEVCVDAFYMGKYEVTVGQWRDFIRDTNYSTDAEKDAGGKEGCYSYGDGGWKWRDGRDWDNPGFSQSASQPVACVSYNDVMAFTEWLNKKENNSFRLPTEAEWEYAARGKRNTIRYWGNDPGRCLQLCQCGRSYFLQRWNNLEQQT